MVNPFTIIKGYLFPPSATAEQLNVVKGFVENAISNDVWSVWSKSYCPYCKNAKALLNSKGQSDQMKCYELDQRDDGRTIQAYLAQRLNKDRVTVPQIFFRGRPIGGCSELQQLDREGKLDKLIQELATR